jgi:DNA polymerase III sliding clamp (beta) subunit (PCNA family)
MRLTISDPIKAETFSQLFQPMKTFTDSINITCKQDELSVQCMDSAMILIAQLSLPKSWFTTYDVEQSEVIGVSTGLLSKVLSIKDKTQHMNVQTIFLYGILVQVRINWYLKKHLKCHYLIWIPN